MRKTFNKLDRNAKFRNSRGWLKPYAFACGYREHHAHPKDGRYYIQLQALGGGYEANLHGPDAYCKSLYAGPMLKLARIAFSKAKQTLIVDVALIKAGVT